MRRRARAGADKTAPYVTASPAGHGQPRAPHLPRTSSAPEVTAAGFSHETALFWPDKAPVGAVSSAKRNLEAGVTSALAGRLSGRPGPCAPRFRGNVELMAVPAAGCGRR